MNDTQRFEKQTRREAVRSAILAPLLGGAAFARQATSAERTYTNPLSVAVADPYVLREQGRYYMYGTGGGKGGTAYPTYTSTDLVNWTPVGETYVRNPDNSWSIGDFWAPEAYHVKGRYYMFFSAQWRDNPKKEWENYKVGVAVSDSPTGPFKDIQNGPLFDPGYPAIDANVLFDTDGRAYLYFSRCCYKHPVESELATWAKSQNLFKEIEESWIYGAELKPDFSGIIGEPVLLLRPPVSMADKSTAWENRSVMSHEVNRRWTEAPTTFKHGGKYYMMYSANSVAGPDYAIGYATADHPLGPFKKATNNPVLQKNTDRGGFVTTTGHNCVTLSPDGTEMYCLYHGRVKGNEERVLFLDRMEIKKDGTLTVQGPTTTPQPYPSAKNMPRG
jgi:beta-xylosidase